MPTMPPRTIVFSHANGFPACTYRVLFEHWRSAGYTVKAIDRLGHDPRYPVGSNWPELRNQLLDFIAAEVDGPAYLVGHSLGGLLSLLAACRQPAAAAGLVMLDSPVLTGWRAHGLRLVKHTGLIQRISPGKVSQRRRQQWPNHQAVYAHFKAKAAFSRWDERVLHDYAHCSFDNAGGQVHLGFLREVETRIYNTLPHDLGQLLRRHPPRCPTAFIAGTESAELRQVGVAATQKLAGERFVWLPGSHLYPMERPDETAAKVLELIGSMP